MDFIQFVQQKLFRQGLSTIPADTINAISKSAAEQEILKKTGVPSGELSTLLARMLVVGADRRNLYTEIEKSLVHPLMGSAVEMYADTSTIKSNVNNAIMWATSTSRDYHREIEKLFEIINIEENIYDWAWTVATYGDLFVDIQAEPGVGIISIADDDHPLNTSRLDYNGRLIGFIDTPMGLTIGDKKMLNTPWSKVHLRSLGAKKRRTFGIQDPNYTEYRAMSTLTPDNRRLTSKYGTSILNNALTIHKRLKMAEDSLLMARINRSRLRYIYKVAIAQGATPQTAAALIDEYITELKRRTTIDIDGVGQFNSQTDLMNDMEDIILPVFGDANGLMVDKIGGDVDVKYIVDIEELRNQLATAIRIPLPMLAGYTKEAPPSLGEGSLPGLDIRFSRQCYRIQRALISGVTRMAQIHFAFQGKDPDMTLFKVEMAETSTAAEQQIRESLDAGVDVVDKIVAMLDNALGSYDKVELLNYLNEKILKLNDLDFDQLVKNVENAAGPLTSPEENVFKQQLNASKEPRKTRKQILEEKNIFVTKPNVENGDLKAFLPQKHEIPEMREVKINEGKETIQEPTGEVTFEYTNKVWESKYKGMTIKIEEDVRPDAKPPKVLGKKDE